MKKVFIDSSVLIAACGSEFGASALVLQYAKEGRIKLFLSIEVIMEAKKNVLLKMGKINVQRLAFFLTTVPYTIARPLKKRDIQKCSQWINAKDVPVLTAAMKTQSDFLLTLDKKHFLQPTVINFAKNLRIVIPGEFIKFFKK